MSKFNNYKSHSSLFDSFNGTELKCYMRVITKYDKFGQASEHKLVEMGNVSSFSGADQFVAEPVTAIGFGRAIAIATGSVLVSGSIMFETLSHGFVQEVKNILKEAGINKISIVADEDSELKYGYEEIEEINDFPLVDIVILGVKENDKNKKIQKEIVGVRFNSGGSAIGVNQLGVREQYGYMAQKMTDFQPVKGAEETDENASTDIYDNIF